MVVKIIVIIGGTEGHDFRSMAFNRSPIKRSPRLNAHVGGCNSQKIDRQLYLFTAMLYELGSNKHHSTAFEMVVQWWQFRVVLIFLPNLRNTKAIYSPGVFWKVASKFSFPTSDITKMLFLRGLEWYLFELHSSLQWWDIADRSSRNYSHPSGCLIEVVFTDAKVILSICGYNILFAMIEVLWASQHYCSR